MKLEVADTATGKLTAMMMRAGDFTPVMDRFGKHMMPSIRRNFDVGGRPKPWDKLANTVVIAAHVWKDSGRKHRTRLRKMGYRVQGQKERGGPLVLTGDLRDSVTYQPEKQDLVLLARPTPGVKGPVHQRGTDRAGKNHNIVIPARPFLVFQTEDVQWFRDSVGGWIRVGSRA